MSEEAGGRVDGCCQSAIGFSIWGISPQASKRQLNRDPVPSSIPCPDNKRPVSTVPLTVTGWGLGNDRSHMEGTAEMSERGGGKKSCFIELITWNRFGG